MNQNYNSLRSGMDTWRKSGVGGTVAWPTSSTKSGYRTWLVNLILLVCCLFAGNSVVAQLAPTYPLTVSSGSYSSIGATGTSIPALATDNAQSNITGLPGFNVNGTTYTNARVSSNGWLILYGTTAPTTTTEGSILSTSVTNAAVTFAPMNADLHISLASGAAPGFFYQTIGNETIFEWRDYARYISGGGNDRLNFQIRLNNSTGSVSFVYGNCTQGTLTGNLQVGWKTNAATAGNWTTDINNLMLDVTGSPVTCDWSNAVSGVTNSSSLYFNSANAGVKPNSGLTYTWTKPTSGQAPVRTFSAVAGITTSGATLAWTAPSGATSYNLQYRAVGSCTWTDFIGNPVASATANLTGLNPNTSYQYRVQASNATNSSVYSNIPTSAGGSATNGYTATGSFTTLQLACTGTPTGGTAAPATANLCPGSTQALTVTGDTSGVSSLAYLWEVSTDGGSSWATAGGTATNATYTTPAYVSGTQLYRRRITCNATSLFDNSSIVTVSGPVAPTTGVTNLASSSASTTSITASWTAGNGNRRIVYVNNTNSFVDPVSPNAPTGTLSTTYAGSGQQLVFDGTGTSVTVTGLTLGTSYYFKVYEANRCSATIYHYAAGVTATLNTADRLKYTIARSSATYTPVSGSATTLSATTGTQDDTNYGAVTFFPFQYAGTTISQFRAVSNGWMTLNASNSSTQYQTGLANSTTVNFVLAPFWEDLYVNNGTPNSQFVKYEITGTAPNRVLTVQWENLELFNYPGPSLNFQVKLYETTNVIEYVYGVMQGFDGTNPNNATVTNGMAFSYATGMSASTWGTPAAAGEIISLQQANSLSFSSVGAITQNEGTNKLNVLPDCNTKYIFTPDVAIRANDPAPGVPAAPANDEPANAIVLTALPSTPANFCGSFYSSAFATASSVANPTLAAPIASTTADDDVWFKFTAISSNTTITLRGSGGYDAAMQVFNANDLTTAIASKNVNNMAGTSLTETINGTDLTTVVNNEYLVRVYHAGGGNQATATATVSGGAITGFTITSGGSGYVTCYGGNTITATPTVYITDATGSGAVAKTTVTGGAISAIAIQGGQGGSGYSSTPTVTISPSSFGVTGDFSIIVNATPEVPANDLICNATTLTVGSTCTPTAGVTTGANGSPEAVCSGNADDDVWYSFVATVDNPTVTVTPGASGLDARVQILSSSDNTCTGTLTSLYCQSTGGGGVAEVVATSGLTIGNTYFVRVYHNAIGSGTGNFNICVTAAVPACVSAPTSPADGASACEGIATVLSWPAVAGATGYDVILDGNTVATNQPGLTYNAGVLSSGGHTWSINPRNFVGTATGCTTWNFSTIAPPTPGTISGPGAIVTGASYDYTSTGGSGFTNIQWKVANTPGGPYTNISGATAATASLTPNVTGTLYLVVGYSTSSCEVLSNELTIVITNPPGETCADAVVLALNTLATTGNLATGGSNVSVNTCGFSTPGNERYYTFTSTFAGTYTLDITNANGGTSYNDYFFKVAAGTADCDLATGWTCIDDNNGVGTDTFTLAANTTYYLLVDSESSSGTANHTFRIVPPVAPNCVTGTISPTNGSTTVGNCAVTLSWASVATATGYDVYLDAGTSASTLVSSNQAGLTYDAGLLTANTAYAWRVVPRNGAGPATGCTDNTFTTTGAIPVCITSPTSPADGGSSCGAGTTTFTWPAASGATSYSLVIDGGTPIVQAGTSYTTPSPLADGPHSWSVTPSNCNGAATGCATWTFTSAANPAGDTFANPVILGAITSNYSVGGENASSCWNDDYTTTSTPGNSNARPGHDLFYQFQITEPGSTLAIGTCVSSFDTYIHLLDATGTRLNGDDDTCTGTGAQPNTTGSYLSNIQLAVGTYYVVVEGYDADNDFGTFTLSFNYVSGLSQAPTGATASPASICPGDASELTVQGGSLGTGATWHWYAGGCGTENGGTEVGTGASLIVTPEDTTTYYVRAESTTVGNTTCASTTVTVTPLSTFYFDGDQDGFGDSLDTVEACEAPEGYASVGGDCDDADDTFFPGAPEVCWNGVAENCTGPLSVGCAPVPVNMTSSYNGTTLPSLATGVPAVPYSYGGFTNLKYRFSITRLASGPNPAVTAPDIIQTSRYVTIPAALHQYGASYTITASAVINEEIVPFAGNTITVIAPTVQLITLATTSCGATLATLTSTLTANPALNATGYTFRIRVNDSTDPLLATYYTSQSATRFVNANSFAGFPLSYGASYKVSVQYSFTDPVSNLTVQSGYGAECTVNTPAIPVTTIASPVCGSTVTALNAAVTAKAASYATGYRFRIRLFADNGPSPQYYYTNVSSSRFSSLNAFQGTTIAYGTEYSVSVQYSILNGSTTEWSQYGPDCKVTTPFFPQTQVVPSQCGQTSVALNQQFNIVPYPGFPQYVVRLDELSTIDESIVASQEITTSYTNFRLNQFSIAQTGKEYNVSIALIINGQQGDFGTVCDISTNLPPRTTNTPIALAFKATAYPNPFAENFMLDVKSSSQSSVNVKVYDMVGRMIEQRDVRMSDMETATIGNNYPSGVYNVVVSQDDSVETVRVVKR